MAPRRSERVAQRAKTALSKRQNLERKSEADKVLTRPVKSKVDKRKGKKAELKITLARFPNLVPNKPKEKENNDKGVESGVRAGPRQRKTGGGRAVSTLKAASNAKEKEVQSAEESGSESDMEDEESDYDEDEQAEETADHTKKVASKTRAQQRKSTQTTKKPNQPKKSTVTRTNKSTAPAKETKSIKGQAAKEAAQTRKQAASAAKAAAVNAKQEVKKAAKERFDAALKQVRDFTGPIRSDADRKRPIIFRGVHKDRRRRVISNGDPYYDNTLGLMAQWWARDSKSPDLLMHIPEGYVVYEHFRKADSTTADDHFYYGHPGGHVFRSRQEFYKHLKFLAVTTVVGPLPPECCPCDYCELPAIPMGQ